MPWRRFLLHRTHHPPTVLQGALAVLRVTLGVDLVNASKVALVNTAKVALVKLGEIDSDKGKMAAYAVLAL